MLAYTGRYQKRKTEVTIPASEADLAGSYVSYTSYNPDGSVAGESYPEAGGLFAEEVFHTYDDFGRPLTTYGGPEGTTVTYAASTQYTRYGEQQRLQLGTGTKRVWLSSYFDPSTRRLNRTIVDAETTNPMQADVNYEYDPTGNVASIVDNALGQDVDRQCLRYDDLRRLTEAWTPSEDCAADADATKLDGPAPYWQSFTYDHADNRRSKVERTAASTATTTYTYPDPGSDRPHALTSTTGAGAQTYKYDNAGNTIARGNQTLTWDELGHLATAGDTSFAYDTAGRRLIRHEPDAITLYLGGQEIRLDRNTGALTGTRYYSHGGGTIAVRTPSNLTWIASDHHGTEQVAIDADKLTTSKRRFDPFGNPRGTQPPSWPDEKGFVGGTVDAGTGLTHLGAREYDPNTGRFISVDPVVDPTDPQQLNAYAYANNSPVTMTDPDGLRYFVDHEGYVTAPPAKAMTPKALKRIEKKIQRVRWRYSKLFTCLADPKCKTPQLDSIPPATYKPKHAPATRATDRVAQHDWNGSSGPRGNVGGYNAKGVPSQSEQRFKVVNDMFNKATGGASPFLGISNGPQFVSGSFCFTAGAGAVISAGMATCLNWDSVGISYSGQGKVGVEIGGGAEATFSLRMNTDSAEDVMSGLTVSGAVSPKLIVGAGGGVKTEVELSLTSGQFSGSVQVDVGIGGKLSLAEASFNAGANTGYLVRWCDINLC
ncbi:RHS repeat-associated core domain-containing protein [Micromonospora yasonensis]|uniref:RHS repeat domain-containing protein n=1 Tax=Micromonospora yasonensis TaxID=1128667 RepID=UPI0022312EE5|nr:RHS repeat-associated core domain-containing protein [Micromonospora yasonensis]MCW3841603.1 RHS repeat-associated core domain-containing protein [Micromonospora yasonensis]